MEKGEYEAQLFGFTSDDFMRAVKCAVKEEVVAFIDKMTNALILKYSPNDPEIEKVKELTKTLLEKYICLSDTPLKNLQSQVEELLRIPAHCLLPTDAAQRKQYTVEEEREADAQIDDLLKRLRRTQAFDVELQQELKMLKDYLPRLQQQVQHCTGETDRTEAVLETLEPDLDRLNDEIKMLQVQSKFIL